MVSTRFTSAQSLEIPAGYHRAVQLGAIWTIITSPYMLLFLLFVLATGGESVTGTPRQMLEIAGTNPLVFGATVLMDGMFHVLLFGTVVTLFAALRLRWPVLASLILVFGAWQMFIGFTKALNSAITFTQLGSDYVVGDAASQAVLIAVASGVDGLRQALQWMDSLGAIGLLVLVSLLPAETGIPRAVRWLGWLISLALLSPDPAFLFVILLTPAWLFLTGRWLKRLSSAPQVTPSITQLESKPGV